MTWVNRYNAKENLQTVTKTKGPWINGKFDARMSGGCNIFGYDTINREWFINSCHE